MEWNISHVMLKIILDCFRLKDILLKLVTTVDDAEDNHSILAK